VKQQAVPDSILLPVDAFHGTGGHGFLDAILGAAFRQNHLSFFFLLVESEYLRAKFYAALTADALFGVDNYFLGH
jgi:hypothetical protein